MSPSYSDGEEQVVREFSFVTFDERIPFIQRKQDGKMERKDCSRLPRMQTSAAGTAFQRVRALG